MDQVLWHVGLLITLTYCENGWDIEDFVDSAPVKFELYPQDHQRLVVNWTAERTQLHVKYEIQVTRSENFNLVGGVNISINPQESGERFHTWSWTSKLPLQCTDHTVRMRRVYNSTSVGRWSPWKTHLGVHEHQGQVWQKPQVFPSGEVLQEKSEVHFCCVAPRDTQVTSIAFNRTEYPLISISDQVKAIAVDNLNTTTDLGVAFECLDSKGIANFTSNFVSFPPQKPRNLSCETDDLKLWSCKWDPGRPSNLQNRKIGHTYTMLVKNSGHGFIKCNTSSCTFPAFSHLHQYNVTVVATSSLGQTMESIEFSTLNRVFPVPKGLSIRTGVAEASLSWIIEGNFTKIPITCQVEINPEGNVIDTQQSEGLVLHFACQLEDLKPSTQYSVRVRCAVLENRWGKWTGPQFFTTYPLVRVDIWRSIKTLPSGRSVIVTWRTYASGTQVNVECEVQLHKQNKLENCTRVSVHHAEFLIDEQSYNISVRAIIRVGTSTPSSIIIPPAEGSENTIISKRVVGSAETGFMVSWTEDASATCGYTIEWCQDGTGVLPCNPSKLQWETVHWTITSLSLRAGAFISGRRYTFNIFGCREDGHRLIETHVGYLQEEIPTACIKIQDSPVVTSTSAIIKWSFPEDDPQHPGFITGYIVTVQEGQWSNQKHNSTQSWWIPLNGLREDGEHTYHIQNLMESRDYMYCIQACTAVGPGPCAPNWLTTNPDYSLFWVKVLTPMAFLVGCCILLWPYWKRLRNTAVEIFTHPTKVNVKIVELDSCLYETSERIQALRVDDCMCCDLEIINVTPSVAEWKCLICPNKDSYSFVPATEQCCTELFHDVWDDSESDRGLSACNFTYSPTVTELSFCRTSFNFDYLLEGQPVQPHNTCSRDYVTSTVMD